MGSGERVSAVFGQGSDVLSTFGRYGQEGRLGFAREIRAAAQLPRGDVLLGGRHGQLIYGRQCGAP